MENMNKCPCCSHHCDRNDLQCGKGESYFNSEANPDAERTHSHHEIKHHGHRHHRPEFPAGSLADLMAKCGHRLFHGGDESMFAALTEEENTALKKILNKLLSC